MNAKLIIFLFFYFNFCSFSQALIGTSPSPNSNLSIDISQDLVDLSTGRINLNVPITTLKVGNFELSVDLIYSSTGLRPEEISGWVGNGWNFTSDNYISRVIYGLPDDINNSEIGYGILNTTVSQTVKNLDVNGDPNTLKTTLQGFKDNKRDTQPDMFSIVLDNQIIRFVFDENGNPRTIDNQDYRIICYREYPGKIIKFEVWDSLGVKYIFDEVEQTVETSNFLSTNVDHANAYNDSQTMTFNSAWKLTKIITTTNKEINFTYRTENINYRTRKMEFNYICKNNNCFQYPTCGNFDPKKYSAVSISAKIVEEISTLNEKITFTSSTTERNDLNGGYALSKIVRSSENSNFIETFDFNTSYIQSSGIIDSSNPYKNYKLQLNSIYLNNKLKNSFVYDNSISQPNRETFEMDYWGYYNGNGASSMITKTYVYLSNSVSKTTFYQRNTTESFIILPGVDRASSFALCQVGVLKKVVYAGGNTTSFDYELNKFIADNVQFEGNGLRVKKIDFTSQDEYSYSKEFFYENNGVVNGFVGKLPVFSYYSPYRGVRYIQNEKLYQENENKRWRLNFTWANCGGTPCFYLLNEDLGSSGWTDYDKAFYKTLRFSSPLSNETNDYKVNYLQVTQIFNNQKVEYNYSKTFSNIDLPLNPELHNINIGRVLCGYSSGAYTDDVVDDAFPFLPDNISSWNKVTLDNIQYIDVNGQVNKREEFEYAVEGKLDNVNFNVNSVNKVFGFKFDYLEAPNPIFMDGQTAVSFPSTPFVVCFAKYPYIIEANKKLKKHRIIEILDGHQFINETEYFYDGSLIRSVFTKDSKGTINHTRYIYPKDLKLSTLVNTGLVSYYSNNIFQIMLNNNYLNYQIEEIQRSDDKIVGAIRSDYNAFRDSDYYTSSLGLFLPKNIMKLDVSQSTFIYQSTTPDPSFTSNDLYKVYKDSNYRTINVVHNYDINGNITESSNNEGLHTSYIWGYSRSRLLAKLDNLKYADIPVGTIANLQNLSNLDNDNCRSSACKDEQLRIALNNLRTAYPDTFISTYTYDYLAGITSETDPTGKVLYYEYDEEMRLKKILDSQGNVLKAYNYNIKY